MAEPLTLDRNAVYMAVNADTGQVIAARVRVADTLATRARGLLGRTGMEPDEGLLITPCDSIHTFFMRFPIDLLYLDKDFYVVKVIANLGPWRMSFCLGMARHVLEMKGGEVKNYKELFGQAVKFEKQA